MNMTPERLAEIEARVKKTTQGPWLVKAELDGFYADRKTTIYAETGNEYLPRMRVVTVGQTRRHFDKDGVHEANIEFIAHAREDIPALLAEVERLTAENRLLAEEWDETQEHAVEKENARRRALGVKSMLSMPDAVVADPGQTAQIDPSEYRCAENS